AGGMHIRPARASPASRQRTSRSGSSAGVQPPFCGSSPTLTWTKQSGRRPVLAVALPSASTSEGRSTEWITSNSRTASSALFDWSRPTRCSLRSGCAARSAGHFACASCTRLSPKSRWPAAISGRIASTACVLETATSVIPSGLRPAFLAALAMAARTAASRADADTWVIAAAIGSAMKHFHPLPRQWLMTDERMGDGLLAALDRLPPGGGIVFRHYRLGEAERHALFRAARERARARGQMLLLAGSAEQARAWGADGSHGHGAGAGFRSASVHDLVELRAAAAA